MTQQDEKKWRELCNQAIAEKDLNKLLTTWLEFNRIIEQEQKRVVAADSSCRHDTRVR
jgi:hypothetical protein